MILRGFHRLHKFVTLTADVMFVNGIAFLTRLSRKIRFLTMKHVTIHMDAQLSSSLKKIGRVYARVGFTVNVILMDVEFGKVTDELDLVRVNTLVAREHAAEIEQGIRSITIKEHSCS